MKKMMLILLFSTLLILNAACPPSGGEAKSLFDASIIERFHQKTYIGKLMHVLRIKEGGHNYQAIGQNGEIGVYQFMPNTWNSLCIRLYGKVQEPTKAIQDTIAYKTLEGHIMKEYTIEQIAAVWNSGDPNSRRSGINSAGVPYDVGAYVRDFVRVFNSLDKLKKPVFFQPGLRLVNDL
jgi:hypothetical protein